MVTQFPSSLAPFLHRFAPHRNWRGKFILLMAMRATSLLPSFSRLAHPRYLIFILSLLIFPLTITLPRDVAQEQYL